MRSLVLLHDGKLAAGKDDGFIDIFGQAAVRVGASGPSGKLVASGSVHAMLELPNLGLAVGTAMGTVDLFDRSRIKKLQQTELVTSKVCCQCWSDMRSWISACVRLRESVTEHNIFVSRTCIAQNGQRDETLYLAKCHPYEFAPRPPHQERKGLSDCRKLIRHASTKHEHIHKRRQR